MIDSGIARWLLVVLGTPVILVLAAGMIAPGVFRWLFDRRGAPQDQGAAALYRAKPIVHVLLTMVALIYSAILWDGLRQYGLGRWSFVAFGFVAVYFVWIMMSPNRLVLDEQGIHRRDLVGRNITILWPELSHVETKGGSFAEFAMDSRSYYRSFGGATISISETTFNTEDILQRIRTQHLCPEQPYRRQHWYGG
jgi:hypothetical protein